MHEKAATITAEAGRTISFVGNKEGKGKSILKGKGDTQRK